MHLEREQFLGLIEYKKSIREKSKEELLAELPPRILKKYEKGVQDGSIRPRGSKPDTEGKSK